MNKKIQNKQCLICGRKLKRLSGQCKNCKSEINTALYSKNNELEIKKYRAKINAINCEFERNVSLLEYTNNELILEYYKMYSYKLLNKEYDENIFFDNNYKYTFKELDTVILHILEHNYLYNISNIEKIIDLSNNKDKYFELLNKIQNKEDEISKEKQLYNNLINNIEIPKQKKFNATFEEGKSFIWFAILVFIIELCLVFFTKIRYFFALIPTAILLSMGLTRLIIRRKSFWFGLLMFGISCVIVVVLYLIIATYFIVLVEYLLELLNELKENNYNILNIWSIL